MRTPAIVAVLNESKGTPLGGAVRVATSLRDRTVGLLGARSLGAGQGLWIERSPSIHMFFMRFPIDAVFIADDGRVTKVVEHLRPWRVVWWARGARDCLELPAGTAAATRTTVGDRLVRQPADHTSRATDSP